MMSNLESIITWKDANTDIYAIERQIKELDKLRDETIKLKIDTEGDKFRITQEIKNITEQIKVLREQLILEQSKIMMKESVNAKVERIKKILLNYKN